VIDYRLNESSQQIQSSQQTQTQTQTQSSLTSLIAIVKSFSAITNFKAIFTTKSVNQKFSSIDGIRAIVSFWVLVEHEYMSGLILIHTKNYSSSASFRMGLEDKYMFLKNVNIVDTFFLIGGQKLN
jgi:hypothetical protein